MSVPHLNQLFRTGKEIKILIERADDEPIEVFIWMRSPSHEQQEQAMAKARAKQARRRVLLKDREGDEFLGLAGDVETMERDNVIDQMLQFKQADIRQQAYHGVLYREELDNEGNAYTKSTEYLSVVLAQQDRLEEIQKHNESLPDGVEAVLPEDDEEFQRILAEINNINAQIDAEEQEILERETILLKRLPIEDLKETFIQELINTDIGLTWYEEYKGWMVFFACRQFEDRNKLYFGSKDDLYDLPDWIRRKLFGEWDAFENPINDIKNSLAPLRS